MSRIQQVNLQVRKGTLSPLKLAERNEEVYPSVLKRILLSACPASYSGDRVPFLTAISQTLALTPTARTPTSLIAGAV